MLERALSHRSWCAEVGGQPSSNERLEFLGDAVLGWMIADIAYREHQELPEGKLTDLRKSVVNASALAEVAIEIGLGSYLRLGKGDLDIAIIDPADTRMKVIAGLEMLKSKREELPHRKHGNIPL